MLLTMSLTAMVLEASKYHRAPSSTRWRGPELPSPPSLLFDGHQDPRAQLSAVQDDGE